MDELSPKSRDVVRSIEMPQNTQALRGVNPHFIGIEILDFLTKAYSAKEASVRSFQGAERAGGRNGGAR
jgi:hypothetical protein